MNKEDTALEEALLGMARYFTRQGRRLMMTSYHSTEDHAANLSMRDSAIRQTMETSGKEERGNRGQYGDKLEGQECKPMYATKGMALSDIFPII